LDLQATTLPTHKALGKSTLAKLMTKPYVCKKIFYSTNQSPLGKRTILALRLQENPYNITTYIHTYIYAYTSSHNQPTSTHHKMT